ncbi:SDR family oxidoreductase [Amylibacter sp.]|nr:SDR family oxidoreductase [Amylibacter sp.]
MTKKNVIDKFKLDGKVALVTGANGILGKIFCEGLVQAGATVAAIDLPETEKKEWDGELPEKTIFFECDVSNKNSVNRCVKSILNTYGRIDILLNNAATKTGTPEDFFTSFEDFSIDVWRNVMSVNVDGMFLMAQAVGPVMVNQGNGVIIQTSSIYGMQAPDQRIYEGSEYMGLKINSPAVYSASKAAVIGLTKWLSTYWANKGIRVNCIVPGGVSSGQNEIFENNYSSRVPMGRMAREDELVPALIYLCSEASSYVTGHVLTVDGGWSVW